jgi:capsular exopolysaccharide synthesis family protein
MSVIEKALSRNREQRAPDDNVVKRAPADPISTAQAQAPLHFRTVTLDAAILEHNCVLPQIADRAVLRAYKILRTRLLQRLAAKNWRSLAVTSMKSGDGKTLTTINLAVALSQGPNTRVCLVDLDLQRPQVATQLGIRCDRGLGDYLLGEAQAEEIIYDCGLPNLLVIPNTRTFDHSSEMLASVRAHDLLRLLDARLPNHLMIFDMPPLTADDVLTFAPRLDGVLLVVAEGRTERAALEKSKELLAEMKLLGVVLNRSAERDDEMSY